MNNLNELIQSGKLPKDCIYYKFVSNTAKYALVDWSRKNDFKWDEDVLEFFQTIKTLGEQQQPNLSAAHVIMEQAEVASRNLTFQMQILAGHLIMP